MFKYIREEMSQTATKIILFCLVLGFFTWGLHGVFAPNSDVIAKHNGVFVSKKELSMFLDSLPAATREKLAQDSKLREEFTKQAIELIIKRKLDLKALKSYDFSYDKVQVANNIKRIDKDFSGVNNYLKGYNMSSEDFLDNMRNDAVFSLVSSSLKAIAVDWPSLDNLNAKFSSVVKDITIAPVNVTKKVLSKKELKEYYQNHKSNYTTNAKAYVTETKFLESDYVKKLKISKDELINFYNSHIDWYAKPAFIKADIYQVKSGTIKKHDFLNQEQMQELAENKQALGSMHSQRFAENTTEPNLYRVLNALDVGKSELSVLDNKDVLLVVREKKVSYLPEFSDIKAKIKEDYTKEKLNKLVLELKEAFAKIVKGNKPNIKKFKEYLSVQEKAVPALGWLADHSKIGHSELNNDELKLVTLNATVASYQKTFEDALPEVRKDASKAFVETESLAKAKKILKQGPKNYKIYSIGPDSITPFGLSHKDLYQMQFYEGRGAAILKSLEGKYYVAFLKGAKYFQAPVKAKSLNQSLSLQKIFFNNLNGELDGSVNLQ